MNGFNKIHLMGEVLEVVQKENTSIKLHVDCVHEEIMNIEVPGTVDVKKGQAIYIDGKMKSGICIADNGTLLLPTGNQTFYSRFK